MMPMLADAVVFHSSGGGTGIVHSFLILLIVAVCLLLIWYAGRWVLTQFGAPAIAQTVWTGLFGLIGLIVIVNFLLSLGGMGFISW